MEYNKLYHKDCIEFMQFEIEDNSLDLVVSDPPYLIDYQSNHRTKTPKLKKIKNDKVKDIYIFKDYIQLCKQKLKENSSIYIFCDYKTIDLFKPVFESEFNLKNLLIWKKNNWGMGDLTGSYAHQYEMILYGHKGRDLLRGKRYTDVLEFDRVAGQNLLHPNEKPVDLLKFLIANSSNEGDIIFDGFAGSGSTLLAARESNRKYIGCELDAMYYNIATTRLAAPIQPRLMED